ncbi:polymorphic toxin-type HINT domain-containing protein [Streptomyces sp. NPDC002018]|uniref:polymorphic toxin-type HINT domain-containing protein n=1 Tax=Streptomyces sp. NPDC002018 TaxID=3364629 RepID=UPI00369B808F
MEWTAENKLATITDDGVKTTYVYDADGNRVLENSATGSTLYLGETELTTDSTGKIIRSSRAYAHPGAPTVVRTTVNGATTGHKLNVLIADHLGTANTTVELGGTQPVTRRAFKPYGEARGPKPSTWPNKRSYLGVGIDDAATGLTHIGAREYDQAAGRFLSADPVIDIADPLQMNGYAYSNNSPVSSSDPTGLMAMANRSGGPSTNTPAPPPPPASSGSSTTVTYTTTKTVTVTKPAPCDWLCRVKGFAREHVTVITVVTEVVVGVGCGIGAAAAGAATAGVGTVVVGTACGAAAGFAAGVVGNAIDPKADHSLGGYMSAAGKGAGVGAVSGVVGAGVGKLAGMAAGKIAQTAVGQAIGKGLKAAGSKLMGKGGASARAGAGTAKCFLAGTPVLLADGTSKNIEDIEVGDKVLATNPATGETSAQPVTELLPSEGEKKLNELTITTASGNKKITATAEHPFWVPQENAWVNAADLKPGTTLSTPDGTTAKIAANHAYTDHVRTYNFSVAKLHTYYVLAGQTPVLVHNACGSNTGGTYGSLKPANQSGLPPQEINHMPQNASTPLGYDRGPAIRMDKVDHRQVWSTGQGSRAEPKAWLMMQRELVGSGRIDEAMQNDINDVTTRFPGKYNNAIGDMIGALSGNTQYQALRTVPQQVHVQLTLW